MAENVVILGAGASMDSGAPLMATFFDVAERQLNLGLFEEDTPQIRKVFEAFSELYKIYAKSTLDAKNIESFFGAIEMARVIEKFGIYEKKEVEELHSGLIKLISRTLDNSLIYLRKTPVNNPKGKSVGHQSWGSYNSFVDEIYRSRASYSIITFNYDVALDYQLYAAGIEIDYGLDDSLKKDVFPLLKLHGSCNWVLNQPFGKVLVYTIENFLSKHNFVEIQRRRVFESTNLPQSSEHDMGKNLGYATLPISKFLHEISDPQPALEGLPGGYINAAIVPPTWTKSDYRKSISNVWKHAAEELYEAKNIYVIGYSLPESDSFFRYLYALGTISPRRIERFWVFNSDTKAGTFQKYRDLIGDTVEDNFFYFPEKFDQIKADFRQRFPALPIAFNDEFDLRLKQIQETKVRYRPSRS